MTYGDRVKETSTTTGTGNVTLLGAVAQFVAFSARFAVDEPFYYVIAGQSGVEWEVGEGHLSAASTLVRDRVIQSSNADAAVNFSAGPKDVFNTFPAEAAMDLGMTLAMSYGYAMP
jgi:hypothetical protein